MPANMVLIEKISVGAAGASSVSFTGIPQTGYTDLVLKCSARTNRASFDEVIGISFNGSTSSFSWRLLNANGTSPGSYNGTTPIMAGRAVAATATASTFSNSEVYIPNYTSSNNKSFSVDSVAENNSSTLNDLDLHAGLWSNTAAITSIALTPQSSGVFEQYSTFYLYGVAKLGTTPAIVPYATGGDTIMTDGTYWYHTFISSGTFTPAKALSCDYLVVAGGGGGGFGGGGYREGGGGGGAGGLRSTVTATGGGGSLESALSLAANTGYTVTIGAGGAAKTSPLQGGSGSNSVFASITSTGGGGGGASDGAGANGGSGGGAGPQLTTVGTGTANQGYAGGAGYVGTAAAGGGGGGAGAVGSAGLSSSTGGAGGAGVAVAITGSSVTYAGGGGGGGYSARGAGGAGGGGQGGIGGGAGNFAGDSGTANTGGGGGGAGYSTSGQGGSGIVIVRYAV